MQRQPGALRLMTGSPSLYNARTSRQTFPTSRFHSRLSNSGDCSRTYFANVLCAEVDTRFNLGLKEAPLYPTRASASSVISCSATPDATLPRLLSGDQ